MSPPLHEQIADHLRRQIHEGELSVGAAIPSESQLCAQWDTSRGPVRQALATLRSEGLIAGGRGKPPVVRQSSLGQPFDTLLSFSAWAHAEGRVPGQHTLELALRPASDEDASALEIEPGERVVQVLRQRLLDGQLTMLERGTFIEPVAKVLFEFDCDSGSLWAHMQAHGADFASASHTIDAVPADEIDAEYLEVPVGTPLLRQRRLARDSSGRPVEWSDDRYRPELVSFTLDNTLDARTALVRNIKSVAS
ncbi:GntR family transcriptional regulator [Luteipulveratus mongoliensis]|uniref:GntR family transcriptional regulator n=1 Tax=Luteipulveratus mongoliensis TaxID=571913 RepID=A0A0K1JEF9_9MICO|nr:GntR family transcriptional regulator [Luteipulveratus mongoliensis]AKU15091.1 GntR family transcriptional regulator [Luteipulveratus mongoliensis]